MLGHPAWYLELGLTRVSEACINKDHEGQNWMFREMAMEMMVEDWGHWSPRSRFWSRPLQMPRLKFALLWLTCIWGKDNDGSIRIYFYRDV